MNEKSQYPTLPRCETGGPLVGSSSSAGGCYQCSCLFELVPLQSVGRYRWLQDHMDVAWLACWSLGCTGSPV